MGIIRDKHILTSLHVSPTIVIMPLPILAEDDNRWSNDWSIKQPSDWIWRFEKKVSWNYSCDTSVAGKIVWRLTPTRTFHSFNRKNRKHFNYRLHINLCNQLAFLDLEYWSNVESKEPNSNRVSRYLEQLRNDLLEEIYTVQKSSNELWQPDCLRPWAVRIRHYCGHSSFGRKSYLQKCEENHWKPCFHDDPSRYGMRNNSAPFYLFLSWNRLGPCFPQVQGEIYARNRVHNNEYEDVCQKCVFGQAYYGGFGCFSHSQIGRSSEYVSN